MIETKYTILPPLLIDPVSTYVEQDADLWTAMKNGSRDALNSLFEKYATSLYHYAKSISRDQALVADCIQDLFIELWIKRNTISDVISIKSYLIKSIRRRVLRRLLTDQRLQLHPGLPEDYPAEVEFSIELTIIHEQESKELMGCLKAAIIDLSERQREAINLKFFENMTYEEIASVMDINVKAAYNLISKAIIVLRKALKEISALDV